jgi:tRNA(adenine34) deaminase
MGLALEEARLAASEGEVPIGAVLVKAGNVLASDHNRSIQSSDPTSHAEILVLRSGGSVLGNYRLVDTTLYVTVEPCVMCLGALIWARVGRVVFATRDPKAGALRSRLDYQSLDFLNHRFEIGEGPFAAVAADLMRAFFRQRRS